MTFQEIIDKHLQKFITLELNKIVGPVETEMADPTLAITEEWQTWFAVESKVTDSDIVDLENRIGHKLPESYINFLKYKHFYELHIAECSFYRHPINKWKDSLLKTIYHTWPTKYMIDKGRIPFADWNDWGVLCFDTTSKRENFNYPIVLWDHDSDEFHYQYENFESMLPELDKADDEMRSFDE